ncbi:HAD family hydrolase [Halobacillus halophilus]|uniref:HAD family hydrolase n=1 Tax=Halobacillus halophilus TaxID=1570 RepID=UPI001CD2F686|nr:HAD hydrolase-like protein [Halobacillus halophilus]MCA1011310.1 HAD hydrolase-like protein [Halobacillus halophilus]
MIDQAECLIFDLDGTLYEDTDHFEYYAQMLQQRASMENRPHIKKDYRKVLAGKHPLQIGKVYDVEKDVILTVDPFSNTAQKVETWRGKVWPKSRTEVIYPDSLTYDLEKLIALGDGWWIPYSIARHYGVSAEEARECYDQTKEYMVSDLFSLTKTEGLRDALLKWKKEKKLVLITNSEAHDVDHILKRIDLTDLFHEIITSAAKPLHTTELFQGLLRNGKYTAGTVISIGDNFMNEIAPALALGMKAIWIYPPGSDWNHKDLKIVKSFEECTKT